MTKMSSSVTKPYVKIRYQVGNRKVHGKNGCTMEDVVDTLIGRLEVYQHGLYKNKDNELALMYLQEAKEALKRRSASYDD